LGSRDRDASPRNDGRTWAEWDVRPEVITGPGGWSVEGII
jgi:hypothetical protein